MTSRDTIRAIDPDQLNTVTGGALTQRLLDWVNKPVFIERKRFRWLGA